MLLISGSFPGFSVWARCLWPSLVWYQHIVFIAGSIADIVIWGWHSPLDCELYEVKDKPIPRSQCLAHAHTLRKSNGKTMIEIMLWQLPYPPSAVTTKPRDVLVASLPLPSCPHRPLCFDPAPTLTTYGWIIAVAHGLLWVSLCSSRYCNLLPGSSSLK